MATRKIIFRGQTRHKGEKTSISGKPLPGIWVTGGIFPQNKGYERAIIYTQDPKVEKHVVYAETVGQYTGVDDVLETPVFEDDIKPKPENLCMSVKASTMHASMCFAKADTCSGNWLTASCATTKVPISNLRGAIVSRAQQRADPNAVCAQFSKTISKRSVFL